MKMGETAAEQFAMIFASVNKEADVYRVQVTATMKCEITTTT